MAIIANNIINSDKFNYSNGHFSAFVSDFGKYAKISARLYDDACDTGFLMQSARTGKVVPFAMIDTIFNIENECVGWQFVAHVNGRDLTATVFND